MGHLLFIILHLAAIMFGLVALVVTIPLHLIYGVNRGSSKKQERLQKKNEPSPKTHLRCPDCKEFVLKEANICKHCRCELTPEEPEEELQGTPFDYS